MKKVALLGHLVAKSFKVVSGLVCDHSLLRFVVIAALQALYKTTNYGNKILMVLFSIQTNTKLLYNKTMFRGNMLLL
jgi:hypothetical protein